MTRNMNVRNLGGSTIDTTFVLFFLALELGRSGEFFSVDTLLLSITLMMVLVLPYFLPSETELPSIFEWLAGRSVVTIFALLLGVAFRRSLGTLLPETFKFIPMTLLIVAAIVSCYIQFYSLMKLRLAK